MNSFQSRSCTAGETGPTQTIMSFVTRFAPSPTGLLHLGHAFSAWTAYAAARDADGAFLLRIEDVDQTRARPEFETAIYEDLSWLGITWEPEVRRQSEHFETYALALQSLVERGLCYRCFRTRKEVMEGIANAPHEHASAFTGEALPQAEEQERLEAGEAFAWRLSLKKARAALGPAYFTLVFEDENGLQRAQPELFGDEIIGRKDFPGSYHLASVWDDALQGVTHVIRGEDLREAAHYHVLLQKLLDLPHPVYRHHRLILDAEGKRLSKRDDAASIRALREAGKTPEEVLAIVGITP